MKYIKIVLIVLLVLSAFAFWLFIGLKVISLIVGYQINNTFETTNIADYGIVDGNYDNETPKKMIYSFFPENIQDNFENVKYSYKARKFDTYGFEAYLEFTISDNDEYEDFVKEYTMGLKGTSFPYDEEYIEYVLEDQFDLVYSNDKVKDGMVYHDGEIFEDPFAISYADVRKIICCPEEQRIIFVAIGVFDGGGTDANFLCAYFNRFNINPREYSINRCD